MAQRILGIDIGTYSVKAVRLKSRLGGSLEYVGSYSEHIEINADDQREATIEALGRLISENKLTGDTLCALMPAQKVSGRFLRLPFGDRRKLDQVIDFEVENHLPFSADKIVTDYQLISKGKNFSDIFIQVAKKSDVAMTLQSLKEAELEPKYLDSESMALYSVMSNTYKDNSCHAILDVGHSKTLLTVMNKNSVAYSHSLDFGGARINESISDKFAVSLQKASALKHDPDRPAEVDEVIDTCVRELADMLKRSIISFELTQKEALGGVMLTGGTANLEGLSEALQEYLEINVKKAGLADFISKSGKNGAGASSIIAYGAALRAKNSSNISNINFKADKTSSMKESQFVFTSLLKVFIMAFILFAFYTGGLMVKKQFKKNALQEYEKRIMVLSNSAFPKLSARGKEVAIVRGKIVGAKLKAERYSAILSKGVTTLDVLKELSDRIASVENGDQVEIYEYHFTEGKDLTIKGESLSYTQDIAMRNSFEESDIFEKVKIGNEVDTPDRKKVKFTMKLDLKHKEE